MESKNTLLGTNMTPITLQTVGEAITVEKGIARAKATSIEKGCYAAFGKVFQFGQGSAFYAVITSETPVKSGPCEGGFLAVDAQFCNGKVDATTY